MIGAVAVIVPARDEAARLSACLTSVRAAADALPTRVRVAVVVASDSCRDATDRIAADHACRDERIHLIPGRWGSAGAARRAATTSALDRLATPPRRTWIASTDADGQVPRDWLTGQLAAGASGWEAVAGIVSIAAEDPHLHARWRAAYPVVPGQPHPYVHGANLGVRADAYLDAGGWDATLATGEDQRLWDVLGCAGRRTLATTELQVETSARLRGRAPDGFAARLEELTG